MKTYGTRIMNKEILDDHKRKKYTLKWLPLEMEMMRGLLPLPFKHF